MRVAAIVLVLVATRAVTSASPTIELRPLSGRPIPDGLGQELQIYLAGSATIVIGPALASTSLQARVREVAGSKADLVTWVDQAPDATGGGFVVVVVGRRDGRAIVDVGEVPASDTSGRLLALQIGSFLDETLSTGAGEQALGAHVTPPARRWLEVSIGGGRGALDEAALAVTVGARRGDWSLDVGLVTRATLAEVSGSTPSLELSEQRVGAVARVARGTGRLDVGATATIDGERVHVVGIDATGERAELDHLHLVVRGTADVRWWVSRQLGLRASAGAERATTVERFLVDGVPLGSIGELRFVASGDLVVRF